MKRMIIRLLAAAAVLSLPVAASAHRQWLLPSATTFSGNAPYVTVESDGLVNLNSASEPVLAALPGIGVARARDIVVRRTGGETFTSPAALADPGPAFALLAIMPSRVLIVSRGWLDGHALTHEIQAVYGIAGTRVYLMTWRERDL